jgi:caffeoyl-CoA O-methyltransferase
MSDLVENPERYFRRFVPERSPLLKGLEAEARGEDIPIVGPVVGELLFILARIVGAGKILELGTATGYSAIFLAGAFQTPQGRLTTLESDPEMAERARENFRRAGLDSQIDIRVGDAFEEMEKIAPPFDMIFMDIDKEDYGGALPHCRRLLRKGGLLVADNVGFKEADPFNRLIFKSLEWKSVSLLSFLPFHSPEKDGLCLALRL